ncbi:hypothetical protein ACTIVE_8948 [Actinomadura verrucosospora]|uniref:Uncharacterized protein n=1 Tax=Actinomadura verrucosospora TaxID=46165 RepID=A0A7D3VZ64_ACTVE|nr:hypothetical protein ACTIVE_8948 [Actinomadura verrucosospora]
MIVGMYPRFRLVGEQQEWIDEEGSVDL